MKFFTEEAVQRVFEILQKECANGKTIIRAKLMEALGLPKEDGVVVDALIKRQLSDVVETKLGPSGGYKLKGADAETVSTNVDEEFVSKVEEKIEAALSVSHKVSVNTIQFALNCALRSPIEKALEKLPQYKLVKGQGIMRA